jgi:transposase-like protein
MRNVLAHAGKSGRRVVSAFIATAFAQETPEAASTQWRAVADQIRPKVPKLAAILDDAEPDVLAYMTFPKEHRAKLHSTNPIERLNGEIKRRTDVVGIFPNDDAIVRLVGALLLEQNDEWAVADSDEVARAFRFQVAHHSGMMSPAFPGAADVLFPVTASGVGQSRNAALSLVRRMLSPVSSMRCALCTILSRMASA